MDDELDGPGLAERWSLDLDTLGWIEAKAGPRRLGLAAQLRHYSLTGRFAESAEAIPPAAARYLAEQTGRPVGELDGYDWARRSAQRHRAEILRRLAIRPIKSEDLKALSIWLEVEVCPRGETLEAMVAEAHRWCLARGHQAPSPSTLGRLARAARRRFEDALLVRLTEGLSPTAVAALEGHARRHRPGSEFHRAQGRPRPGRAREPARRRRSARLPPQARVAAGRARRRRRAGDRALAPARGAGERLGDAPPSAGTATGAARPLSAVTRGGAGRRSRRPAHRDGAQDRACAPSGACSRR